MASSRVTKEVWREASFIKEERREVNLEREERILEPPPIKPRLELGGGV